MSTKLEKLMEENNALLRQQAAQFGSMCAILQTIMVYLPACASERGADRKAVMRLANACAVAEKDFQPKKRVRKRLKKRIY